MGSAGFLRPAPAAEPAQAAPATSAVPAVPATGAVKAHYRLSISAPEALIEPIRERTLIGRWRERPDYDPDQFESLFSHIEAEVVSLARVYGYFDARVEVAGDSTEVRINVSAGPRATVARLQLEVQGPAADDPALAERWRERWALPEGSFFLPDKWEQGKRVLLEAIHWAGYLRARLVDSEATVDVLASAVHLKLIIDSGPRLNLGTLRINGLRHFDSKLVEDLKPFRTGDPYSFERLLQFQTRLSQVGYFNSASVLPDLETLEREPQTLDVPVLIDVTEVRGQRVALGAGFSTDNGPRLQLGYDQRNLFGSGWQAESALLLEPSHQRLFGNVRSPIASDGSFKALGSSLDRQDVAGERVLRTSTYVGQGRRFFDGEAFFSLTHQSESRTLASAAGEPAPTDSRVAWLLGYSRTLNRLDALLDPRRGYSLTGQVSTASRALGSDRSFTRFYGRGRYFLPMPAESSLAGGTLVGLLELGVVAAQSREDIPSENLFRTGGSQSVRGYRYLSLGVAEAQAVTGGRYLAVGSLEYQHPIAEALRAALFYDRGNAADALQGFKTFAGYGFGARWKTPVGPVMIDLAWGEATSRPRLHMSVGYGF